MELGLCNVFANVSKARIGNDWTFNANVIAEDFSAVFFVKSSDLLASDVVWVISERRRSEELYPGFSP